MEKINGKRTVDIGEIAMHPDSYTLDEVEIRAEKSETVFALDKKIFNVGKDLANRGGSAADVLDNVPSVSVDIEGNVSLRGSTGVRILVDGRPSGLIGLSDSQGLRQLSSNMIDRIEVITNPSARYEAEGMAGIINIVLKKDQRGGFNGAFDATIGYPEQYGLGANVNYRKGAVNWFANYNVRLSDNPGQGFSRRDYFIDGVPNFTDLDRDMQRSGLSNSLRGGLDYFLGDKENITASFLYKISDEDNITTLMYQDYVGSRDNEPYNITKRTDDELEEEQDLEYSLNYKRQFSSKEHTITASFPVLAAFTKLDFASLKSI